MGVPRAFWLGNYDDSVDERNTSASADISPHPHRETLRLHSLS